MQKINELIQPPAKCDGVGARLRAWRKSEGMKGLEFAKLIQISQGSLSALENGNSLPSAETLKNIFYLTDLDIRYLLTGITEFDNGEHYSPPEPKKPPV